MRVRRLAVALLLCAPIAACGGDDGGSNGVIEGQDVVVDMFDNRFEYTEIRIPVGGSVTWVGAGRNPHNAVDAAGAWSTEDVFGSLEQLDGDEAVLTYTQSGEYVFFCTFHGNAAGAGMAGTLIVGGDS
ncbi:MAG: plastocyanin/azurin family copper-binding protein [Acidimicrobiia bacterium]